jgi:hypothetical protein
MTRRWSPECRGGLGPWAWLEALARAALAEPPEWHPADEELIALLGRTGARARLERRRTLAHLEGCGPCRDAVLAVAAME